MAAPRKCYCVLPYGKQVGVEGSTYFQISNKEFLTKTLFYNETDAIEHARDEAMKNPKIAFIVFQATTVFEAKKPEIISKEYKASGELIPRQEPEASI